MKPPSRDCREPLEAFISIPFLLPWNSRVLSQTTDRKRILRVADTKKIEDKAERKKVKRTARKKAAPKGKRTAPRGSNKKKIKKMARGQSKR